MESDMDLERKKKKDEKLKEKELKKQKALQKAQARTAEATKESDGSKKAEKKPKKQADAPIDEPDPETPFGERKRLAEKMASGFNPTLVEKSWYDWWEKDKFFVADPHCKDKPNFVMVIPPPNVTGVLHIGHALMVAVEDAIVRYHRMCGYNVLWVPGVDHAGISTQVVVEKNIAKRNLTRHDLGREDFVAEVWKWKEEHGGTICRQIRRMGASVDWSRECFTMDDHRSRAVIEAFVRLHEQGLIYRDNRLVNWDCHLRTAISDIEVEHIPISRRTSIRVPGYDEGVEFGTLTSFAYPLEDGSGEIVVATTRPETMFGDVAVAVHPEDPRYQHLIGKFVQHPFIAKRIPIIADAELVDMSFGTGAVKITPAHDHNDWKTGRRHKLETINIFTDDGKINSIGGPQFEGMKRYHARTAVIEALDKKGLYRGTVDYETNLGICSRTGEVIEPIIRPQWYVNCKDMAKKAADAVRQNDLDIVPPQFQANWFRWLDDIRDWCISRQLWWGHRIPAWYAILETDEVKKVGTYTDHWAVARTEDEAKIILEKRFPGATFKMEQDPDVLDTWFSSGLFPFSVMGWPDNTDDLKAFYPTMLLETGHDILFFWVARMVMMGIQLTGQLPFNKIFLHAMVRDAHGRKMSKSLGNVIDPLDVIHGITLDGLKEKLKLGNLSSTELKKATEGLEKDFPSGIPECGADALRFGLVAYTAQAENINLDIQRVIGYRHWCNKLWNAIRFAILNLGEDFVPSEELDAARIPWCCKWILSALNSTVWKTNNCFQDYDLSGASTAVYSWWQYELCDVFIELTKPILVTADEKTKTATKNILWRCLDQGLRLLHPFMPYVTEELWQRLPRKKAETSSIMLASYPIESKEWSNPEVEMEMSRVSEIAKAARTVCAAYTLSPKQRPACFLVSSDKEDAEALGLYEREIVTLGNLLSLKILKDQSEVPAGCAVSIINESLSVYVMLEGVVKFKEELSKLVKQKEDANGKTEALRKKMGVQGYKEKVPVEVQEADGEKLAKLEAGLDLILDAIQRLEKFVIE